MSVERVARTKEGDAGRRVADDVIDVGPEREILKLVSILASAAPLRPPSRSWLGLRETSVLSIDTLDVSCSVKGRVDASSRCRPRVTAGACAIALVVLRCGERRIASCRHYNY